MRIFLIGFMGSGKSHTGKRLAARIGTPFMDQDTLIERRTGKSVSQIFAEDGEATFRQLEADILRELHQLPRFVLATGGGAPVHHDNMDWMLQHGITIFLDPTVEVITERLAGETTHRPLLREREDLREFVTAKLAERRPCYEKAAIHLRPAYAKEDVARLIADQLTNITGH